MIRVLSINKQNNRIASYTCTDGIKVANINKKELIEFIKKKQVVNATMQVYNGSTIVRVSGIGKKKHRALNVPETITQEYVQDHYLRCEHVEIPYGVRKIGRLAFYNCYELKSIILPDTVEVIAEMALYSCTSLININIPKNVKYIGSHAFSGLNKLETVTVERGTFAEQWCLNYGYGANGKLRYKD